ncbi:hypothetical protein SAZ11_06780 [Streptomyces sp. FXJ1.4098]|nr:hypothetical protein [Streptomyces sp. FXJ1.4098]
MAEIGIVAVDRLHQGERGDLGEVFHILALIAETQRQAFCHGQPRTDDRLTQGVALRPRRKPGKASEVTVGVGSVVMAPVASRGC